jgi:adenosine kinase
VGKDFAPYRQRLEAVGVDTATCRVIEEVYTATFFANTDADNNQIGAFYSGAMGYAKYFGILEVAGTRPDLVVISPNDPQGMANHIEECRRLDIPYIFDPSQQVARLDAEVLQRGIQGCIALACNEYEWEIIQKHTGYTLEKLQEGGHIFIHTLGADGAAIYHQGEKFAITPVPPYHIENPTGAGDAFRSGFLRGWSLGFPLQVCGQMGALCGTYALEHSGTQGHQFTIPEFMVRFRQHYDDAGVLEALS